MNKMQLKSLNLSAILFCCALILGGCDRNLSDDVQFATFPNNPEVYTDNFGVLEYLPFLGSKPDAFSTDEDIAFEGLASFRVDVPNVGDPTGAFAGAILRDEVGRNLTEYDALTFYARASQAATLNAVGFGQDFGENKFQVTVNDLRLSTNWVKYTIPIPDASRLVAERGMFWYSEGADNGDGYTFWFDDIRFERTGTVAQPRPAILGGEDRVESSFIGSTRAITGTQTFSIADGQNVTVSAAPAYFTYTSSDLSVARVDEQGIVTVVGGGTAVISATLNGVRAAGSLTIESLGQFQPAPTPTLPAANVISIFSDAYTNVPVDFYNGFFAPFQTTLGGAGLVINGDNIIQYTELNFVATEFTNPTVNASEMTHFHVDIQVENPINGGDFVTIELADFGANGAFDGGGDDSSGRVTISGDRFTTRQWVSIDIPLADFGLASQANMAQIFFITDGSVPDLPGTITDILVDNMYFYRQ